ncbi:MAG: hypothetical protein AAB074_14810 [Planctomycetota bacterium]
MNGAQVRGAMVLAAASAAAAIIGWKAFAIRERPAPARQAGDSFAVFCREVVPVLDRRCGGCHGVPGDVYDAIAAEPLNRTLLRWPVDESGRIATAGQRVEAFRRLTQTSAGGGKQFAPLDRRGPALASQILRAPLAESLGGYVHAEVFASVADPDFVALAAWASLEISASPEPAATLSPGAETFFAERVVPILERKTCFGSNCHGKLAFNDLKLDPGIPALRERFTPALHRANRRAMLGEVTRLVNLSGDVEQSKQLKKSIPVEQGGIVHKGGNNFLEKGDPDYAVVKEWLERERAEARKATGAALGDLRGIVFVRRPRATPERYFEPLVWLPGADVILLRDGRETNLTAALHPSAPADIRAAEVSYDARRISFAMRRSEEEPFNVWEIELESGAARQITFSTDPAVHFVDPVYVPDPEDADGLRLDLADLVVLSNFSGEFCEVSPDGVLGEAEGGTADAIEDAELREKAGTFDGRRLRVLRGANTGEARTISRQEPGRLQLDRPFPSPCDSTTHYVIDAPVRVAPKFDLYRMKLAAPGGERAAFQATLRRMTWSPSQARRPSLRSSGEVMATFLRAGWQEGRPFFNGAIFRTHIDGSNFHTHGGNRSGLPIHADGREAADGLEVRIGRDADSWWGGVPILVDHQFGPHIEDRNPLDDLDHPWRNGPPKSAMTRFASAWIPLDETASCRGLSPGGAWHDLFPMPDGSILASFAPGPVDLDDPSAAPDFDIVRLVPDPAFQSADGFAGGKFRRETLAGGPSAELWPRPVAPHLKEPLSKTIKIDEDLFGPAPRDRGLARYPAGAASVLQVFDLPLLDAFFTQSTPVGVRHIASDVCPSCGDATPDIDQVHLARIVGLQARPDPAAQPRRFLIAEVPLAEDGSIQAAIPAGIAFDIESVNARGMALRSPNRWLYTLPGERHTLSIPRPLFAQTCGGCHGGLTGAPADILRRPDIITSASRTQAIWDVEKRRKLLPSNWDGGRAPAPVEVSFEKSVRPILERRCLECHEGSGAVSGVNLAGEAAYDTLLRFIDLDDRRAIVSRLAERLEGRELHAPGVAPAAPHPDGAPLPDEDLRAIYRWIDLGAER